MKHKYLFIIIPLFISCEFSTKNYESNSDKKYQKIGTEVVDSGIGDTLALKKGSKAHKLNTKGIKLGIKHEYIEAEKIFNKALLEHPNNPTILNNIGLTFYHRGIYNTAIKYFNQALAISDSTSVMSASNLGLTYYHQMDYARALNIMDFSLSEQKLDNTEELLVRLNRLIKRLSST